MTDANKPNPPQVPARAAAPAAEEAPKKLPLICRLIGMRRRQGRFLKVALTWRGWITTILLVMILGMAGVMEYTMQPEFCRSCHLMEPYYQAWHNSTHKNVPCVDCHFEPGLANTLKGKFEASSQAIKFITKTYGSKPHAQVHDSSCLRSGCHEKRILEGKVNWEIRKDPKLVITFNHAPHLKQERRGKQLRCVSCHSQIVQGQHLVVTLDTCFLCHFKDLPHGRHEETIAGCTSCHSAPKDKIILPTGVFDHKEYVARGVTCINCHSDSIKGQGEVPLQVCWVCHNQPAQIARYGESRFIHETHVSGHKVECSSCHVVIEHNLTANANRLFKLPDGDHAAKAGDQGACTQCHEQSHLGPTLLFSGTGGRGVKDMPSPMFRAQVDCIACHKTTKRTTEAAGVVGQTYLAMQESCDYCHRDKYKGSLEEWRQTIQSHLQRAETVYDQARTRLESTSLDGEGRKQVARSLADAAHNIRLVKLGHGVHNVNYATALLNKAIEYCEKSTSPVRETGP